MFIVVQRIVTSLKDIWTSRNRCGNRNDESKELPRISRIVELHKCLVIRTSHALARREGPRESTTGLVTRRRDVRETRRGEIRAKVGPMGAASAKSGPRWGPGELDLYSRLKGKRTYASYVTRISMRSGHTRRRMVCVSSYRGPDVLHPFFVAASGPRGPGFTLDIWRSRRGIDRNFCGFIGYF